MSVNDCEKHDWNGKAQKLVPKCPWCRIALLEAAGATIISAIRFGLSQDELEAMEEFELLLQEQKK